jgi:hypothetical protein
LSLAASVEAGISISTPWSSAYNALVSALFAVHRRVVVRMADSAGAVEFCTCGDVWPCRVEDAAARILDRR